MSGDKKKFSAWTFGRGLEIGGTILDGLGRQSQISSSVASVYSQARSMYDTAANNRLSASYQDMFTYLEDQEFARTISQAMSKQDASFAGRGLAGGASADAIRRSSRKSLQRARGMKRMVGKTRSMALRMQAEQLEHNAAKSIKYAQQSSKTSTGLNLFSTALNVASIFYPKP